MEPNDLKIAEAVAEDGVRVYKMMRRKLRISRAVAVGFAVACVLAVIWGHIT